MKSLLHAYRREPARRDREDGGREWVDLAHEHAPVTVPLSTDRLFDDTREKLVWNAVSFGIADLWLIKRRDRRIEPLERVERDPFRRDRADHEPPRVLNPHGDFRDGLHPI